MPYTHVQLAQASEYWTGSACPSGPATSVRAQAGPRPAISYTEYSFTQSTCCVKALHSCTIYYIHIQVILHALHSFQVILHALHNLAARQGPCTPLALTRPAVLYTEYSRCKGPTFTECLQCKDSTFTEYLRYKGPTFTEYLQCKALLHMHYTI